MNNLFSFDADTRGLDCEKFVIRRVGGATEARQQYALDEMTRAQKASESPLWLTIIGAACFLIGLIALNVFLDALTDGYLKKAYDRAGWFLIAGGVCLVLGIAIAVYGIFRKKAVINQPVVKSIRDNYDMTCKAGYDELGVPDDADDMDIFTYAYRMKRGKRRRATAFAMYINVGIKIFKRDERLFIADASKLIALPVSSIKAVRKVNKYAGFDNWTKDVPPNAPAYKPYKIYRNSYGTYGVKPYYSVEIEHCGESYEIIVPPYEQEVLLKYVGSALITQ